MTLSIHELSVLLVEPSAMQRKIIQDQLAKSGVAQIFSAGSGADAMAMMRANPPGATVSAMYLPDMTGTDLVLAMRTDPATASVPFILVSSETRTQVLDPVRQSGVCGILPKPFTQAQLSASLQATLDLINPASESDSDNFPIESMRVLLVDDSPMARKHIRRVLENMGFKNLVEAENGLAAIKILDESMVDLVVSDYNMPEMDGQGLLDHIRTKSWQNTVPVLMVTSETDEGRLAAVHGMGVIGVCDKPFEPATVRSLLRGLIS